MSHLLIKNKEIHTITDEIIGELTNSGISKSRIVDFALNLDMETGTQKTVTIKGLTFSLVKCGEFDISIELQSSRISNSDLHKIRLMEMGEMAANIIHDIQNPLSFIAAGSDLLKLDLEEFDFDTEALELMNEHVNIIKTGIKQITDISVGMKLLSRKEQPKMESIDLNKLIGGTVSVLTGLLNKRNIDIDTSDVTSLAVKCKSSLISQVLSNLIKNAADEVETLSLKDKWIKISTHEDLNFSYIKVMDGGSGIPLDKKDSIFEPFFTTKDTDKGTGLGLSSAREILEAHKGDIFIEDNKNTVFVVKLPK